MVFTHITILKYQKKKSLFFVNSRMISNMDQSTHNTKKEKVIGQIC